MSKDRKYIMEFFNNNKTPFFECDKNLIVITINSFIEDRMIDINVGDNLYNISSENEDLLNEALITVEKGLPFCSTNFMFNLLITTISIVPINYNDGEYDSLLCNINLDEKNYSVLQKHDFPNKLNNLYNNPIAHIINTLPLLAHKLEMLEEYDDLAYLNEIAQNCYCMLRTSTVATTFYRLLNNMIHFKMKKILLNNYLRDLLNTLQVMFVDSGYRIHYDITNEPIIVQCDEEYLSTALFHIISNSCLYSPKGSTIKVSLVQNNDSAHITILDEGVGIKPEVIQCVFNPYYSDKKNLKINEIDGMGLGLPIVKRIIDAFKGTIFISSEANKGTTIALGLPIAEDNDTPLELKSNTTKYITNKFSNMYIYFSEICKISYF